MSDSCVDYVVAGAGTAGCVLATAGSAVGKSIRGRERHQRRSQVRARAGVVQRL